MSATSLDKQEIVSSLIETYRKIMGKWHLHNGGHVLYHTENRRDHGLIFLCPEFANLRIIVFTRKVAENHGRVFPVPILFYGHEFARLVIGHELSNLRIFIFRELPRYSVWKQFDNSIIRDEKKNIRDTPWHSVWYRQDIDGNNSVIFSDLGVKVSSLMVIGC